MNESPITQKRQSRRGVEALRLREPRAEVVVELRDARDAAHRELRCRVAADVLVVLDIELVVDLADDLLDDVLDGAQSRHAAVLIDHDRHVVAVAAELPQQHVQALGSSIAGRAHQLPRSGRHAVA